MYQTPGLLYFSGVTILFMQEESVFSCQVHGFWPQNGGMKHPSRSPGHLCCHPSRWWNFIGRLNRRLGDLKILLLEVLGLAWLVACKNSCCWLVRILFLHVFLQPGWTFSLVNGPSKWAISWGFCFAPTRKCWHFTPLFGKKHQFWREKSS